jgi:poly(3-hydroxybutyrate) depolymerase
VFFFHGRNNPAAVMATFTRFDVKANSEGFILVVPVGLPIAMIPGTTSAFNSILAPGEPNDLQFTIDMLDELEAELCIDPG